MSQHQICNVTRDLKTPRLPSRQRPLRAHCFLNLSTSASTEIAFWSCSLLRETIHTRKQCQLEPTNLRKKKKKTSIKPRHGPSSAVPTSNMATLRYARLCLTLFYRRAIDRYASCLGPSNQKTGRSNFLHQEIPAKGPFTLVTIPNLLH